MMQLKLHAARQALKLGLALGVFATLAGFGQIAGANAPRRAASTPALRLAHATPEAPRTAAATGTVELPPGAEGEPAGRRLVSTEDDPDRARRMNAALAFSTAPILAAKAFVVSGAPSDRARALTCLTQAVYYEAGFEPVAGQRAVAQVVLNRMRHPSFPHSVCGVVFQGADLPTGCQFSFTCDGSLLRGEPALAAWRRSQTVAREALAGRVEAAIGTATHYHADYVAPYWMTTVAKMARIGQHIFYRWPGTAGLPAAFAERYAATEHAPSPLQLAAWRAKNAPAAGLRGFAPGPGVTLGADGAIYVAQKDEDGRVHGQIFTGAAESEPATPTARRAALLSGHGGALPAGLETVGAASSASAEPPSPPPAPAAG